MSFSLSHRLVMFTSVIVNGPNGFVNGISGIRIGGKVGVMLYIFRVSIVIIVLWVVLLFKLDLLILLVDEFSSVHLNEIIGFVLDAVLHFDLFYAFGVKVSCMHMIFVHRLCFLMVYVVLVFASLGGVYFSYREWSQWFR